MVGFILLAIIATVFYFGLLVSRDNVWDVKIVSYDKLETDINRAREISVKHMWLFRTINYRFDTTQKFYDDSRWVSKNGHIFKHRSKVREALDKLTDNAETESIARELWSSPIDTDSVD